MKKRRKNWVFPAVVLLAVSSLALAMFHSHFKQNATSNIAISSSRPEVSAQDPNAPDPEGGVPTLAPVSRQ